MKHALIPSQETAIQSPSPSSLGIAGMEDFDTSMLPIPFVRLVQPTSKKITCSNGKEATPGSYFFSDIQESFDPLTFVLLKAKHGVKEFEDPTTKERVPKKILGILGYIPEKDKLFLLTLSVMSFSPFGSFLAQLKSQNITKSWQRYTVLSSTKIENEKGKFYIGNFVIGKKLSEEEEAKMDVLAVQYAGVLEKKTFNEEEDVIPAQEAEPIPIGEKPVSEDISDDIPF